MLQEAAQLEQTKQNKTRGCAGSCFPPQLEKARLELALSKSAPV